MENLYECYLNSIGVSTDSRNIKEGMMFFALKGENFDANDFVQDAIDAGASIVVTQNRKFENNSNCFYTEDSLKTLQDLARYHRSKLKCPIIGITGTNGKTTTKELTREALSCVGKVYATQGNFNNHIGVPLTLLAIDDTIDFAIIEMGANHPKEIDFLCSISRPDYGLITNIGKAHLEGFGSYEGVVKTKCELYDFLTSNGGVAFVNEDEPILNEKSAGLEKISYSKKILNFEPQNSEESLFASFSWKADDKVYYVESNICGGYNFPNFMSAIAVSQYFGANPQCVSKKLQEYVPTNNRSQVMKTSKNTLIVDAYNANPSSMAVAVKNFIELDLSNKILILGDMRELGQDSLCEHKKVLDNICSNGYSNNVILIGSQFFHFKEEFKKFYFFETVENAIEFCKKNTIKDAHILIKGSRGIRTEKMIDVL